MANYNYKEGFHSEYLARFILSKFSYISEPPNPSEDPGIDFYCTYFNLEKIGKSHITIPVQSYVIQIKSYEKNHIINLNGYKQLLNNLELPFFIGIVDRHKQNLKIYAGVGIPILFSFRGSKILENPESKLLAELTEKNDRLSYLIIPGEQEYILRFPLVAELTTAFSYKNIEQSKRLNKFKEMLYKMKNNISTRINNEYIFTELGQNSSVIMAGPGSTETYLENFFKRLAECLQNLAYMNHPKHRHLFTARLEKDSEVIGSIYEMIKKNYQELPSYLTICHETYLDSIRNKLYPDPGDSSTGLTGASEAKTSNNE